MEKNLLLNILSLSLVINVLLYVFDNAYIWDLLVILIVVCVIFNSNSSKIKLKNNLMVIVLFNQNSLLDPIVGVAAFAILGGVGLVYGLYRWFTKTSYDLPQGHTPLVQELNELPQGHTPLVQELNELPQGHTPLVQELNELVRWKSDINIQDVFNGNSFIQVDDLYLNNFLFDLQFWERMVTNMSADNLVYTIITILQFISVTNSNDLVLSVQLAGRFNYIRFSQSYFVDLLNKLLALVSKSNHQFKSIFFDSLKNLLNLRLPIHELFHAKLESVFRDLERNLRLPFYLDFPDLENFNSQKFFKNTLKFLIEKLEIRLQSYFNDLEIFHKFIKSLLINLHGDYDEIKEYFKPFLSEFKVKLGFVLNTLKALSTESITISERISLLSSALFITSCQLYNEADIILSELIQKTKEVAIRIRR